MPHHSMGTILADKKQEAEDQEHYAEVRALVRDAATRGRHVRGIHPDEMRAAFAGHEDALREVQDLMKRAGQRQAARDEAAAQREAIRSETKRVLKEWDRERELQAQAEARRRLGIKDEQ